MKNEKLRNVLPFLVFFLLAGGAVFADEGDEADEVTPSPKNTIIVDIAPTISGLLFGVYFSDYRTVIITGFGIHYERQITESTSVSARFAYGKIGLFGKRAYEDYIQRDDDYYLDMSSISAEGHYRYYPTQSVFFLDGMIGYANFIFDTVGKEKIIAHYLKLGGKIGFRTDFGKPGGLVFEPAFGFAIAIGEDKTFSSDGTLSRFLDNTLAKGLFAGGIRISLGLGYRF